METIVTAPESNRPVAGRPLDDGLLQTIDTEGRAYLLGWIAGTGVVQPGTIAIDVHARDRGVLDQLRRILGAELPIRRTNEARVGLVIDSRAIVQDACRHLRIQPGSGSREVDFPELGSEELRWAFLRGVFDAGGSICPSGRDDAPRASLSIASARMRQAILELSPFRCSRTPDVCRLEWQGNNALDLLGRLYEEATCRLARNYDLYRDWCMWIPPLTGRAGRRERELHFRWSRSSERAVPPFKNRVTDSGYDLTLIDVVKRFGNVTLYTTGISVQPAFGWYFDLVPRSSLSTTGYAVANSVGIIDRTYTGPIMVPLVRLDPSAPELELPARVVQIVPRPIVHVQLEEVDELDETARGPGGFGSTGR